MVQIINDEYGGSIAGRLGRGFGKGLAEQAPKEVERYRLSSGLKELEGQNLTPKQYFTRALAIPGMTPQAIESLGRLTQQEARANALNKVNEEARRSPFPEEKAGITEPSNTEEAPSLTTRQPIEATLNPYIPKSMEEINRRAGELYNKNPGFYNNDPQQAINAAVQEDQQNQSINQALQGKRTNEQAVQDKIVSGLREQSKNLGVEVPSNVFSEIEDKAINALKSKENKGEGLTEQEALKKYGEELDTISRDYKAIETLGTAKLLTKNAADNKASLRSLRTKFKERDDLENFADSMIAKNGLSPSKAYYLAYPVSDVKEVNNTINKLPKIEKTVKFQPGYPLLEVPKEYSRDKTLEAAQKIAPLMNKESSILSIAEELKSRNYDPKVWMDYVDKNRKKLNLSERQGRELDKPREFINTLNDLWMFYFSGLDNLVEQE